MRVSQIVVKSVSTSASATTAAVLLLNFAVTVSSPVMDRNCGSFKLFYDHGTDNCEQCREICRHADIMGTVEQCRESCPQYLTYMKCEEEADTYYDDILDICSPCSQICDNHRATGTTRECQEKCKGYMDKLTPEQVPSLHRQNSLKAIHSLDENESTSATTLHPGWIASIVVGSVAIICTILVVIILYVTCSNQYAPAPQHDQDGAEQGSTRQPVEETVQGSTDSPHFAINSAAPHTAFADLRDDGNRNNSLI